MGEAEEVSGEKNLSGNPSDQSDEPGDSKQGGGLNLVTTCGSWPESDPRLEQPIPNSRIFALASSSILVADKNFLQCLICFWLEVL